MNKTIRNIIIAVAAIALAAVIALVAFGDQGGKKSAQETVTGIMAAFEDVGRIQGNAAADVQLTVNADAIAGVSALTGGSSSMAGMTEIMEPVTAILSNVSFHALTEAENGIVEIALKLKDTDMASVGVKLGEKEAQIVSDLIPGYIITADPAQAGVNATGILSLTEEEKKAFSDAAEAKFKAFEETVRGKLGEAEKGSWTFEEIEFTEKQPLEMTAKEIAALCLQTVKDLLEDPASAKVAEAFGSQLNAAKIDEAMAELEKRDEKDIPEMTYFLYSNKKGNEYHDIAMASEKSKVNAGVLIIDKKLSVKAEIFPETGHGVINASMDAETLTSNVTADVDTADGKVMRVAFDMKGEKDGAYAGTMAMSMEGNDILTLNLTGKPTDEKPVLSYETEGKKVVSTEALNDGSEEGRELASQLTIALPSILTKANEVMPDEVGKLMTLFGGMMPSQQ